ncbi:hypothetical protein BOX15_Mlig018520g2 [Macrostomum lignano]|uniref:Uncharacterized protein n=1 Tax=Macrostomum lignano TaxID=282301 RepID=A0A267EMD7_9PLAT|nr:hypothetical protein BOX15_Mlig018520g3 [Macrostomum lignano]PAA62616.1 hypothetical protein BOX15_Mlig018520g2 [Macrostomum lignano]
MSEQQRASGIGGKVTILSSGQPAQTSLEGSGASSTAATTVPKNAASSRNSRRKVGTNLERSFVDPGAGSARQAQQGQEAQQQRPVLKAGKSVTSAPTPMQQRPMSDLEKAFSEKPVQDQRWLLSFPLALKQLYFGFAESTNHEQTLLALINRFPELLAGNDQHPSAILIAIRKGNWTPALHFIEACIKGEQTRQLTQRCSGAERRTFLIEAVLRTAEENENSDIGPAMKVMTTLAEACPELLSTTDSAGKNPLHYCSEQSKWYSTLLLPLLTELRQLALNSQILARRLGNALATGDLSGKRPIDLLEISSAEGINIQKALQGLMAELPVGEEDQELEGDESMQSSSATSLLLPSGPEAMDKICSELAMQKKSAEFVELLSSSLSAVDPQAMLLSTVEQPERVALQWFGKAQPDAVKQALSNVGLGEFCGLVDRL